MDTREAASELRREIDIRIDDVLAAASLPPGEVYVSWVAALEVATCPLRYRVGGGDGWGFPGWSPALAGGAVGRAALLHHLGTRHTRPTTSVRIDAHSHSTSTQRPPAPPQPVAAVRAWMREAGRGRVNTRVADWIVSLVDANDRASLAATAAFASRWLAGFVRVAGWPLPDGLAVVTDDPDDPHGRHWHKTYRPRPSRSGYSGERPSARSSNQNAPSDRLVIASSPDAVLGKVTSSGGYGVVVHRPSIPHDAVVVDRAAVEAVAAGLVTGVMPAHIVVTAGDTGETLRFPVDDTLIARGSQLIVDVVRQRVIATGQDAHDAADATPSTACHHCPGLDRCQPGQTWIAGPGRWRDGLPSLPAAELANRTMATAELPVR